MPIRILMRLLAYQGKQIKTEMHESETRFMAFWLEIDTFGKFLTNTPIKIISKIKHINFGELRMKMKKGRTSSAKIMPK